MNKVILLPNEFGGFSVLIPTGEVPLEQVIANDVPAGMPYVVIDQVALPAERDFRNAWEFTDGGVGVSLPKAKDITKDRLRRERAPLLAALDVEFQRAIEEGKPTADIVARKQALRDITNQADNALTLEALRSITCTA